MVLTAYVNKMRFFRPAAVGLLAGCAWFAASTFAVSIPALAQANATAATQSSDSALRTSVLSAIQTDGSLRGQHISASVANGVVTLTGTVQTQAQSERAETDAVGISGVNGIRNQLKITRVGTNTQSAGITAQSAANQLNPQNQASTANSSMTAEPAQAGVQASAPPPPPDTAQPPQTEQAQQSPYPPQPSNGEYRQPYYPNPRVPYNVQSYAQRPNYGEQQQRPEVPYYATPTSPVTIPAGTMLRVRLSGPLSSAQTAAGTYFQATAANDVYEGGVLAIPTGAALTGQVVSVRPGGRLAGSAILELRLTSVNLSGKIYPLSTDVWSSEGPSKTGYTARNTTGGAILGAIIGGIVGGGGGAAAGAALGGVGGLAASGASHGARVYLPTEAALSFRLSAPATVQPVPWQEAQRLAASAPRPTLVRRPRPAYLVAPYPYYSPYYAPYYGPYYAPYYGPYPY